VRIVYTGMTHAIAADTRAQNARIAAAIAAQQSRLRAFVRRRVGDTGDAEEIVQEVFYELVLAHRLLQPIEHLAAWLLRVARNRIVDRFRTRSARSRIAAPAPELDDVEDAASLLDTLEVPAASTPEAAYARALLSDALEAALAELPVAQREVFVAHELEGRTFKAIAAASGIGVNTLLARKHAAVRHLRARLKVVHDELEQWS
jgi:RNA polymerase sigma factor (sigma-70 family)